MAAQTLQEQTESRSAVPASAMDLAVQKVRSLLRLAPQPVLFARVKLTMPPIWPPGGPRLPKPIWTSTDG